MKISRRTWVAAAVTAPVAVAAGGWALSRRARSQRGPSIFREEIVGDRRIIQANGLPSHATGDFPNAHDPIGIRAQQHRFEVAVKPVAAEKPTPLAMWLFGVAVNGVPFDPSGPFWNSDGKAGWQFEVLCPTNAVALGIDVNRAHVQGRGVYHYHGLPTGLLWDQRQRDPDQFLQLLGYAADGFPIYGPDAPSLADDSESPTRRLRSSYRLRPGRRPSGPGGRFDGTFVEDFAYEAGLGDLDDCNGRVGPTPQFPDGTYYYVLTDEFPFIPRAYRGTPNTTFRHGPPPGVSPPLPRELRSYQGVS